MKNTWEAEIRNTYIILVANPKGKILERRNETREDNSKMHTEKYVERLGMD
jgi:hypothetical protein